MVIGKDAWTLQIQRAIDNTAGKDVTEVEGTLMG